MDRLPTRIYKPLQNFQEKNMPHLQFEINKPVSDDSKQVFAEKVRQLFSEVMGTGTDHISISIREYGTFNLSLGRIKAPREGIGLVNADIREGRTIEQRRTLALGFISLLTETFGIPGTNTYVTFTEHKGEDFHLQERYLKSWKNGEDPLND